MKTLAERCAKLVVVIDDDPLVLEATAGLLSSWGCQVVTAVSYDVALQKLTEIGRRPDLIVCDYRLSEENSGVDVIQGLRNVFEIPALLISGDAVAPGDQEKSGRNYYLLQKPLNAARFRAALVGASVLQS
jgi:CheY-like chemotaxis protein